MIIEAPVMAMGRNQLLPKSGWLASTTRRGEPRNAVLLTAILSLLCLMLRDLNAVAPLVTMFFLITYLVLNLVLLIESSLGLTSFRPALTVPRVVPLLGVLGGLFSMVIPTRSRSAAAKQAPARGYDLAARHRQAAPGWHTVGFTTFHNRDFGLSVRITRFDSDESPSALQLFIDQGARKSWRGVSGSPVLVDDIAAGVITSVTDNTATAWAAPERPIADLIQLSDNHDLHQRIEDFVSRQHGQEESRLLVKDVLGRKGDIGLVWRGGPDMVQSLNDELEHEDRRSAQAAVAGAVSRRPSASTSCAGC